MIVGPLGGSVNALTAVGVWAALASVPTPVQKPLNVVPLTLKYGSQPAPQPALATPKQVVVRVWWPEANEPRLQYNVQQPERRYIAPLTLAYGNQPPVAGPLSATETNVAVRWWDAPRAEPPQLVKLVQTTGDQPPLVGPITPTEMSEIRFTWEPPRSEPPGLVKIAPLTLVYGDQPPRFVQPNVVRAWDAPASLPPQPIGTAAWNIPAIVLQVPFFRPPVAYAVLDWSAQHGSQIAPLLLVYGQQPPIAGPLSVGQLANILAQSPALWWNAQSESDNAHWNVPTVASFVPYTRLQDAVLRAWEPPFLYPESEASSAGWNFVVPFVPYVPYARFQQQVLAEGVTWSAQSANANAAWNVLLTRAIAQSDASDGLTSGPSSSAGVVAQNDATVSIGGNSRTIALFTAQNATISIVPTE